MISNRKIHISGLLSFVYMTAAVWTVLLGLGGPVLSGDQKPVFHASMEQASQAAEMDQSLVLVVFRASWCVFSKEFNKTTLNNAEFTQAPILVHVVPVDTDANAALSQEFNVGALPDLVLLTPGGKIVARRQGLMRPQELMGWLNQSAASAQHGEWLGFNPSGELGRFLEKFKEANPAPKDCEKLVAMLGSSNPGDRVFASEVVMRLEKLIMPYLIQGLKSDRLSIRVGAADMLFKLAPNAPESDPWASADQRAAAHKVVSQWWENTKDKGLASNKRQREKRYGRSVEDAIKAILSNDPVNRTLAMTYLVELGSDVLPAVRGGIVRAENGGDSRAVLALEDVRWSILIPGEIASQMPETRNVLARGMGTERREATLKLGKLGPLALPALGELVLDKDPLVQENALMSLEQIKSDKAIDIMASLLDSDNANIRMVAVQMLGHSENPKAVKYIEKVIGDPEEVVALTAIAALEEVGKEAQNAADAIILRLKDPRWRIRAAAAETVANLEIIAARKPLQHMLNDPDPFVIKNVLAACAALRVNLSPEELLGIMTRHPDLVQFGCEHFAMLGSGEDADRFLKLYAMSPQKIQYALLDVQMEEGALAREGALEKMAAFFEEELQSQDETLRKKTARVLEQNAGMETMAYVSRMLKNQDQEVRKTGARMAVYFVALGYGFANNYEDNRDLGVMKYLDPDAAKPIPDAHLYRDETPEKMLERARELREIYNEWHQLLMDIPPTEPDWTYSLATYLTGPANQNYQDMLQGLTTEALNHYTPPYGIEFMLFRLPWPESKEIVHTLCSTPGMYVRLISTLTQRGGQIQEFLLESHRFVAALEDAGTGTAIDVMNVFLDENYNQAVYLGSDTLENRELAKEMMTSENTFLNAVGIVISKVHGNRNPKDYKKFLKSKDPEVQREAIVATAQCFSDLNARAKALSYLIENPTTSEKVNTTLLAVLLNQDISDYTGIYAYLGKFQYGEFSVRNSQNYIDHPRPPQRIEKKPQYYKTVVKNFRFAEDSERCMLVLFQAQYGDFSPLDAALENPELVQSDFFQKTFYAGIWLSQNDKYLKFIEQYANRAQTGHEIQEALTPFMAFTSKEARELRKRLNRRIREMR